MRPEAPVIDWEALSPLVALTVGACVVLMVGLLRWRFARQVVVPGLTLVCLGTNLTAEQEAKLKEAFGQA